MLMMHKILTLLASTVNPTPSFKGPCRNGSKPQLLLLCLPGFLAVLVNCIALPIVFASCLVKTVEAKSFPAGLTPFYTNSLQTLNLIGLPEFQKAVHFSSFTPCHRFL